MEPVELSVDEAGQSLSADSINFARSYQLEALEMAIKQNTIVFLETGSGKTLIAIMLLRSYAHILRKPSPYIAVFLVPTVVLVNQQSEALAMHTDLEIGKYWGELGVDYWDAAMWKQQQNDFEVFVMTPAILLAALRHSFLKIDMIKVLIFDECHNARGKHPYACIMTEFYHRHLALSDPKLPRILGMTASPIKAKGSKFSSACWKQIHQLENLMNSKVYTCVSESVLAEYIPFSTSKLKMYNHVDIPFPMLESLTSELKRLKSKHEYSLQQSCISDSVAESARKKVSKLFSTFLFCLNELGIWSALKAAESLSCQQADIFSWKDLDVCGETVVRDFSLDAFKVFTASMPSDPEWSIFNNMIGNMHAGFLTSKVTCLVESLLEYRHLKDLRCIIFVERIITAIVLRALLNELAAELSGWRTEYTAGNDSGLQSQSRKEQIKVVEDFRQGKVNIIVATSILEEGLDVQSCNLVIRFDPSATICSFIQSRGRARMKNSEFLLMVRSGDTSTLNRLDTYLGSGDMMRQVSLAHSSLPCDYLNSDHSSESCYLVERTGAIVNLSSSVALLYFYCSRLPSDGYFKPSPRFITDKELGTCILYLPKSCPIQTISVQGNIKTLKQLACLEACKQLHQSGALTDNLVPDIVQEEADALEFSSEPYNNLQEKYSPAELISNCSNDPERVYHCYLIELQQDFNNDISLRGTVLAVRIKLEFDDDTFTFDLDVDRGRLMVQMRYVGVIGITSEQVQLCQKFQVTLFRILLDCNLDNLDEAVSGFQLRSGSAVYDYLLLPCTDVHKSIHIDWSCVGSVLFPCQNPWDKQTGCSLTSGHKRRVYTKNGYLCRCMLENSLVLTPHNGFLYIITGTLDDLDGNSLLKLKDGKVITYKDYYEKRHGINLCFEGESLLNGKSIPTVQNYLLRCRSLKVQGPSNASVELPPELCFIIMSPISMAIIHSFTFLPSAMHRFESLLIAANLKRMLSNNSVQNGTIPTTKVLEAITTKRCQEKFHLETLETLGDSFLKYAATQQLFKTHQDHHEGLLSIRKERIISNAALCKLGCERNIVGFIRNEAFDPKAWIIPGDKLKACALSEEILPSSTKVYIKEKRNIKVKTVADVVEALIGAFLSIGGQSAGLSFMQWLGIRVDLEIVPYTRHFPVSAERLVNIKYLESLLNYSFHDATLLVEALTHGSYMLPEIPRCYQRLEFLGDSVLDYLITVHLYNKHPGLSPGLLTDLRSASVNNDCYAQSVLKAGLHKHILHASQELHRQIAATVHNFEQSASFSTFGWESETTFPKVLGDIIESLAGAILVDSGYNLDIVFQSIRPLLEPLITPETLKLHPVRELTELCQKEHYIMKKPVVSCENGVASITIEIEANGITFKHSCSEGDKKSAKRMACKSILEQLKENLPTNM